MMGEVTWQVVSSVSQVTSNQLMLSRCVWECEACHVALSRIYSKANCQF